MSKRELQEDAYLLGKELERRRENDPLKTWKPFPKQKEFIDSILEERTTEAWAVCGNRAGKCITPWTPVEMDHATRQPLEVLGETSFDVETWDGENRGTSVASELFLKGIFPALRIHLDNGQAFEATYTHRVLTSAGWASLDSLLSNPDDPHYTGRFVDYRGNYDKGNGQYDLPPLWELDSDKAKSLLKDGFLRHTHAGIDKTGVRGPTQERIHACLASFPHASPDDPEMLSALFSLWDNCFYDTTLRQMNNSPQDVSQSQLELNPDPKARQSLWTQDQQAVLPFYYFSSPIPLLGVQIIGYQKIGLCPIIDFTVDKTHCYYASGAIHHNSDSGAYIGSKLARFGLKTPRSNFSGSGKDFMDVRDRATSGWVSGLDFPTLRGTLQPKYHDNGYVPPGATHKPFIPDREIKEWKKAENTLKLKNGSLIEFKSADSGSSKYQGAEKDWIHLDEEHPKEIYDEISIRIGANKMYLFVTATLLPPEGVNTGGVTWAYPEVLQPFMQRKRPKEDLMCFSWGIYDNPHIPPEMITKLEAKYDPNSPQGRIRLRGEWLPGLSGSRAYTKFNARLHVLPQQDYYDPRLPLSWSWDFNVEPMVSVVGQRQGGVFRFMKEFYLQEGSIPDMIQFFYDAYSTHQSEIWVYGDATGKHRSGQSKISNYTMIQNALHQLPLRLKVPETNPSISDRINAVNYQFQNEKGMIGIEVDPSCLELIMDFEMVLRGKDNKIKKITNKRDPYFYRTHISDAAGYWICYEEPIKRNYTGTKRARIKQPSYGLQETF